MTDRKSRKLTVVIHDEGDDGLWAEVREMPGLFVTGDDLAEVQEALTEAITLYLSDDDKPAHVTLLGDPEPMDSVTVTSQQVAVC
ncbi:type II toxin-antitoxin system HicB family antitoxin [Actinomadura parmotrematis]|uniref:Type II toxin-antitoxin system HicB family antitoxin n=1 Tax=Actinomadura parmotrematis TaxID=2864039 RepID=A0ABS7FP66_9ACTN|nr:type II toxin-antitoxin system HicB family antitoxin [Actinomadura parmotrematis]MBW8482173.1 type II toxin-antitoxin system HicB family antitoxin [Actinomadura parmotrematis]